MNARPHADPILHHYLQYANTNSDISRFLNDKQLDPTYIYMSVIEHSDVYWLGGKSPVVGILFIHVSVPVSKTKAMVN